MINFEERILDRYYIDVNSKRKVRGGFLLETEQGLFQLSNISGSAKKIPYVDYICRNLEENGRTNIDRILVDKEGDFVNTDRDQGDFVLKKWFMGRSCDVRRNGEIFQAVRELATLHLQLQEVSQQIIKMQKALDYDIRWDNYVNMDLVSRYKRHNAELNKVRRFIRGKTHKGPFEFLYLNEFETVYKRATEITKELEVSEYPRLHNMAVGAMSFVHGDYNYHNVLFTGPHTVITNFNKFKIDVQVADLYNFLRKVMEKRGWDVYLGGDIISAYEEVRMLSDAECEYIRIRLSYPEKYWKVTNQYYNSNKAWVSDQIVEKLVREANQMCIKQEFVERLFNK